MFEEERQLRARFDPDDEEGYRAARLAQVAQESFDRGTVADVVDHIEHIARVAGVDHVGIGSDFDGVDALPVGLEDVSCYPAITAELLSREWDESDIRKVLGGNALRVLGAADRESANRRGI
jgi:membrane dipeptidase